MLLGKELERLKADNLVLRSNVVALEKQTSLRFFKDQKGAMERFSKFAGTRAVIFCDPEGRTVDTGEQISIVLKMAHWNIDFITIPVIESGVRVGEAYHKFQVRQFEEPIKALITELNQSDIEAGPLLFTEPPETFKGVVIQVGPRPSSDEAELIGIDNELKSMEFTRATDEQLGKLFERRMELEKKQSGTNNTHWTGGIIHARSYPQR